MRGDGVAAAPAAIALRRRGVAHREVLRLQERDGRRPHGLDENLAGAHEVDRLLEGGPEATELALLLELDEIRHQLVDLGLRHVALVDEGHLTSGLSGHCQIDQADLRVVDDGDLALELRVNEDRPRVLLAELLLVVAEGVGVVVRRNQRDEVRLLLAGQRLVVRSEQLAERGVALSRVVALGKSAVGDQRRDLAKASHGRRGDGLQVAGRPRLIELMVVAREDVERVGLRQHDLRRLRRALDGPLDRDARVVLLVHGLDRVALVDADAQDAKYALVGGRVSGRGCGSGVAARAGRRTGVAATTRGKRTHCGQADAGDACVPDELATIHAAHVVGFRTAHPFPLWSL